MTRFGFQLKQHRQLHRLLKTSPVILKKFRPVFEWEQKGFPAPSPSFVKRSVLLRLIEPGQKFVETGTYKGGTTRVLRSAGYEVTTIEVHKPLYDEHSPQLKQLGVNCLLGDSGKVFQDLLPDFREKDVFFWLDGHFSAGITGIGDCETPIAEELEQINKNLLPSARKITIAIDDFRCFPQETAQSNYPSRGFLVDWARDNNFSWDVEHDIFVMKNA
ncbi:hypothetical protein IWQ55_002743 [Labrenzia sp. EL_208]|nr:hypothetical protein [Labrenzia sp. EL_132]MBG6229530.1 hypothetical protein [Labrenzia sp. EL_208]